MALSKRKRAEYFRYSQYTLLVLIAVVIAFLADWEQIRTAFFNFGTMGEMLPNVITIALKNTLIYTALGFAFGLALGLVLALMKLSSIAPYRWIATIYIEFFRGIPALLVFIGLAYGVPLAFQLQFDIYSTVMLALGIVGAAYIAETIRAASRPCRRGRSRRRARWACPRAARCSPS